MRAGNEKTVLVVACVVVFVLLALPLVDPSAGLALAGGRSQGARSQLQPQQSNSTSSSGQQPPSVLVNESVTISPVYDFYAAGISNIVATVNATGVHQSGPVALVSTFTPTQVTAIGTFTNGTSVTIPVVVNSGATGSQVYNYDLNIPNATASLLLTVEGEQSGSALLWRYITTLPTLYVQSFPGAFPSTTTTVDLPSGSEVSQSYDALGNPLSSNQFVYAGTISGYASYYASPEVGSIMVQSNLFVPVAAAITVIAALVVALAALNYFAFGRSLIRRISAPFSRIVPGSVLKPGRSNLTRALKGLMTTRKLLVLFILCAILMASLALATGPDPRLKVYAIADDSAVPAISNSLSPMAPHGVVVITPSQDYSDFCTMASVGEFNAAVISNYPSLQLPEVSKFVLGCLSDVPIIVVDKSANPTFVAQIELLDASHVVNVTNAQSLTQSEQGQVSSLLQASARYNLLGFSISATGFKLVLAAEGVLSFVIVLLGWAFLGTLIADPERGSDLSHLALVVSSGIFVFFFSMMTYIVISAMLAVPLSLHAVISGAKDITAVGILGFGGGSTPRLAAGFVGVFAGALSAGGRQKFRKGDIALIAGLVLLLLANPLQIGQFAYTALLLFAGNFSFGSAYVSSLSLKGFLYSIGSALGGDVSGTYVMSAGTMLYFAGLPLLAFAKKMSRTTSAIAILLSALIIGDGGVRIGQMTPYQTVIGVLPGLVAGLAFTLFILILSAVERYIRSSRRRVPQ